MAKRPEEQKKRISSRHAEGNAPLQHEVQDASTEVRNALRAVEEFNELRRNAASVPLSRRTEDHAIKCLAPALRHLDDAVVDFVSGRRSNAMQSQSAAFIALSILAKVHEGSVGPEPGEEHDFDLGRCINSLRSAHAGLMAGDFAGATEDLRAAAMSAQRMPESLRQDIARVRQLL